jgi:hypothetical protein
MTISQWHAVLHGRRIESSKTILSEHQAVHWRFKFPKLSMAADSNNWQLSGIMTLWRRYYKRFQNCDITTINMQTILQRFMSYTKITTIILIISVGTWREISLSRRSNTQRDGTSLAASSAASCPVLSFSPQNCNSVAWVLSLPNIWLVMNYWTIRAAHHKQHYSNVQ